MYASLFMAESLGLIHNLFLVKKKEDGQMKIN